MEPYPLYSSLIAALLDCNQFKFKLVRYCQSKTDDGSTVKARRYCDEVVARPSNVVLRYRDDQKLWVFLEGDQSITVDLLEVPASGKQALVLLMQFHLLCSKREMVSGKVVCWDWCQLSFFQQTFVEQLKRNSEKIFQQIPSPSPLLSPPDSNNNNNQ